MGTKSGLESYQQEQSPNNQLKDRAFLPLGSMAQEQALPAARMRWLSLPSHPQQDGRLGMISNPGSGMGRGCKGNAPETDRGKGLDKYSIDSSSFVQALDKLNSRFPIRGRSSKWRVHAGGIGTIPSPQYGIPHGTVITETSSN